MEYLKSLHNKEPTLGGASNHDTCIKEMYSCGRERKSTLISNLMGFITIVTVVIFVIYRFINKPEALNLSKLIVFATEHEMFKMFIGLLLLTNIKTLSNSLIANIILPLIKPLLPFLSCNLKITIGLFSINIGDFISDIIIFMLNIYIIYMLFAIVY